ncbi:MAG: hypothetical protein ACMX3H_20085 [Sodalis sp. (in: enterobacteria)]|uniref:hypothetical protein n=1 Tax=Sodalis sp. (in: enterobacteria) TaxID=1898979 RepID=UPI0039E3036D
MPPGYDQLKATLPYFTHEVQLARRYVHDLLEQFSHGMALCLGDDATSCQPIQRYLAQALRTGDRGILQPAGNRLRWHLAKIDHYL